MCSSDLSKQPSKGQVAQLVEQRTENPRVGGSIPSLATTIYFTAIVVPFGLVFVPKETWMGTDAPVGALAGTTTLA